MLVVAVVAALLAGPSARAQELEAPHTWRVGLSTGVSGTLAMGEAITQLSEARFELDAATQVSMMMERWVSPSIALGCGLYWRGLRLYRDSTRSAFDVFGLLAHAAIAARASPTSAGGEAALDLAAGPAFVRWTHRGATADAVGLGLRLGARLGQGLHGGFTWSVRPWMGTTLAWIGPARLDTADLSAGVDLHAGWGW